MHLEGTLLDERTPGIDGALLFEVQIVQQQPHEVLGPRGPGFRIGNDPNIIVPEPEVEGLVCVQCRVFRAQDPSLWNGFDEAILVPQEI